MGAKLVEQGQNGAVQRPVRQANPDAVINRLAMQISQLQVAVTVRDDIIDQLETRIVELEGERVESAIP